ncbi:hypothetical protein [Fontivita pretiosa]|uniref:hypothetical protein n=1 Tax=Fontivita pretiosa TaxID=2989684 RepID=UPI003D16E61D
MNQQHPPTPARRIKHLDFNLADLNQWMEGKTHEQIGRTMTAIGLACQANDERYLEQFSFIDRIIYTDRSVRKIIRGSGRLDDLAGIDRPIASDANKPSRPSSKREKSGRKSQPPRRSVHT